MKAASHQWVGPDALMVPMPLFPNSKLERALQVNYHDLAAVQNAPFTVKYRNGKVYRGCLNAEGKADLTDAPPGTGRLEIGEDTRKYQVKAAESNPDYRANWSEADMDASLAAIQERTK